MLFLRVGIDFEDTNSHLDLNGNILNEKKLMAIRFINSVGMIISMGYILFICLATTYEEEKQKRYEFLVNHKISSESKLVQDIFSMLVPKFVKNSMIEGFFFLLKKKCFFFFR